MPSMRRHRRGRATASSLICSNARYEFQSGLSNVARGRAGRRTEINSPRHSDASAAPAATRELTARRRISIDEFSLVEEAVGQAGRRLERRSAGGRSDNVSPPTRRLRSPSTRRSAARGRRLARYGFDHEQCKRRRRRSFIPHSLVDRERRWHDRARGRERRIVVGGCNGQRSAQKQQGGQEAEGRQVEVARLGV